jgi:hypothetical protein
MSGAWALTAHITAATIVAMSNERRRQRQVALVEGRG